MIELHTLGALDLRDGDNVELRPVLVQPKRTAILVYLAVATPRGFHRRDALLALFWPDQDAPHARSALRQALHGLRQALGDDVVVTRGNEEIGLDPARSRCDVWAFEQALDAGDLERAVALYRGPFLAGFFLTGALEFERWVEAERDQLGRRYAATLEDLALGAERRGEPAAALHWWGRLAEHSPHASRVALRFMRSLDAAGDRAGAIRHADQQAARLREDLGAEPDLEVEALAAQLRTQPSRHDPLLPVATSAVPRSPAAPPAGPAAVPREPSVSRPTTLLAALVLLVAAGWWVIATVRTRTPPLHRIAVLPLANQTGDSAQQYLVDGVHEAVITELAQIGRLSVISRSSVVHYRGSGKSVPEIARELHVDALVEGAVLQAGDSLRVTLQLIDARHDRHLWARTFEGDVRHLLSLSREAAQSIAQGVRVTLTPEDVTRLAGRGVTDPAVSAAYLRARWQFNLNTGEALQRSIAFYRQAIALDSGFAPAWAGLADDYVILGHESGAPPGVFLQAREMASRALVLDATQPDAHAVLAHVAFEYDWDWAEAERLFRRAIELSPSDARAHFIYGGFLLAMSRFEEAGRELRSAGELDPLSPAIAAVSALPSVFTGRYAEAEETLRAAQRIFPGDEEILSDLGYLHALEGRFAEAAAELSRVSATSGRLAWVYGRAGHRDSAVAVRRRLEARARQNYMSPMEFVRVYLGLDDRPRALEQLEAAYRERSRGMAWLRVSPDLAPLRDEPRFRALLARMRFPG